ncbi:hypothetical protein JW851_03965 [Candidatus Woesearchaeota archaeon]|nr:hypothetical protein [Candidatus Woesearchaeota archaeon]
MDEREIRTKKKQMLVILKEARELAIKGNCQEALNLLTTSFIQLETEVFGLFHKSNKFDMARNAIQLICFESDGSPIYKKGIKETIETGKKNSLRLIAELEEELQ